MAKIEGLDKVQAILRKRMAEARVEDNVSVVVGYSQKYSIFVHENLEAHHTVGQAKFLEQPARTMTDVLGKIIKDSLDQNRSMAQALTLAGLRLQRESQLLVPVDSGALRASAFTRLDRG